MEPVGFRSYNEFKSRYSEFKSRYNEYKSRYNVITILLLKFFFYSWPQ